MERTGRLHGETESEDLGPDEPSAGLDRWKMALLAFSIAGPVLILYYAGFLGEAPAVFEFLLLYVGLILVAIVIMYLTLRFALSIVLKPS